MITKYNINYYTPLVNIISNTDPDLRICALISTDPVIFFSLVNFFQDFFHDQPHSVKTIDDDDDTLIWIYHQNEWIRRVSRYDTHVLAGFMIDC